MITLHHIKTNRMEIKIRLSDKLVNYAKLARKIENRSLSDQIEFWAQIGKMAEENPDMPYGLTKEILVGMEELNRGEVTEYTFG